MNSRRPSSPKECAAAFIDRVPGATGGDGWPVFDDEMIGAVERVLRSGKVNYWTGNEGRQFEQEFADYVACRHAVALANGTVALELALHALGISAGDEVVVPSRTFVATAMAVVRVGAVPVFADVDRDSQNVTAETIAAHLSPRTRAVIVVHLAGWPADMDSILALANTHGLAVVEDCAQALGARYKGRVVGSIGDVGAYSFCQDKILTTGGEGGMLVTNRPEVWQRAWSLKDHGKLPNAWEGAAQPSSQYRWLHESIGSNFRLTEMQAAIGRIGLRRLPEWLAARKRNAERLIDACRGCPGLRTPVPPPSALHANYKFYTFVRPECLAESWSRERIVSTIRGHGVPCISGACSEIYLERAFPAEWRPPRRHPVARELGETSLMFQVHPTLSADDLSAVAQVVREVVSSAAAIERPILQRPVQERQAA